MRYIDLLVATSLVLSDAAVLGPANNVKPSFHHHIVREPLSLPLNTTLSSSEHFVECRGPPLPNLNPSDCRYAKSMLPKDDDPPDEHQLWEPIFSNVPVEATSDTYILPVFSRSGSCQISVETDRATYGTWADVGEVLEEIERLCWNMHPDGARIGGGLTGATDSITVIVKNVAAQSNPLGGTMDRGGNSSVAVARRRY